MSDIASSAAGEVSLLAPAAGRTYYGPFAIMTILFFLWGFMTVFNDILIPRFKEAFTLSYFQAMLVQFAFFGAYFIGALLYFVISATTGDPIAKIGYKNGVVIGLADLRHGQRAVLAGGRRHFLSDVPGGAVHRGPRVRHAADRRQSLRHHPRPGENGLQPVEPGARVQLHRHDHRAADRRLADLPVLCHAAARTGRSR